ncbi:MAG: hypothetical protein R2710_16045 [Acidimicrobiales bacterium]
MIPRVVYGLSNLGLGTPPSAQCRPRHTPLRATVVAASVIVVLAVGVEPALASVHPRPWGSSSPSTRRSWVIKHRIGPTTTFQVPIWVPSIGIVASAAMWVRSVAGSACLTERQWTGFGSVCVEAMAARGRGA